MKQTISACLVVYNEEAVIERCLASISPVVDEIIVVHDGEPKDTTLEIAKKYGAKTFVKEHAGMCEAHRVFAFEKASSDWIMLIDADEFLSKELAEVIPKLVTSDEYDAYDALWCLWDGEKYITTEWPHKVFLYRKSQLYYLGFPHEKLNTYGKLKQIDEQLEHQPKYNNYTWKSFWKKWVPWAKIQARESLKDFNEIPKFNVKDSNDWPVKMRLATKFSFLFPLITIYIFFLGVKGGSWKEGWFGMRQSWKWALYNGMVYYYVTLYKTGLK
jgi:glycosyltransferase involved in cell wall biosynthesis